MTTSLIGTSLCKDTKCIECISRLSCSLTLLIKNLEVVADVLNTSVEELFPTLEFHKLIIEGGNNENI